MENTSREEPFNFWMLSNNVSGPAIAFIVALHFVLALPLNLFVIVFSLYHPKKFKKSAIILLFNLALSNLILVIFYMPFVIVASGAREWIIGGSDNSRRVLCQIHGFIYEYSITVFGHILVVISVDRFLYIVKANVHHKIMTWKVTLGILATIWILSIFWCLAPYYGSGLGMYNWSITGGGCLSFILHDSLKATLVYIVYTLLLFVIIVVTTVWTFIFTHGFLKKKLRRRQEVFDSEEEKQVYLQKVGSLAGILGALLAVNALSWIAYFVPVFYALIGEEVEKVPEEVDTMLLIFSFTNTVANPMIQIFFRKDMRETCKRFITVLNKKIISNSGTSKSDTKKEQLENGSQDHIQTVYSSLSTNVRNGSLLNKGTTNYKPHSQLNGHHNNNDKIGVELEGYQEK